MTTIGRAASTIAEIGPRPVLISRYVGHHAVRRVRRARLRRTYGRRIATPPAVSRLRVPAIDLPPAHALPDALAGAAERIRREAEDVLAHRFDFLGSGLVELGAEIDWQRDFKSGYRWPSLPYDRVQVTRLDDVSDAKVPWELSRGHHLLTLARAARLYEDERFAAELERQIADWIDANPVGVGINWVNPMEVGLRAVNWIWAIGTLEGLRPLEAELRVRAARSLACHARHIRANLEETPLLRGNHYLADVLGLLAIGYAVEDDPKAERFQRLARRSLEREIVAQVLPDGCNFEASLPYHGLAMEMFAAARVIARLAGTPLSAEYDAQLRRMLDVSRAVRHPDGRSPQFGDSDSGRVLPAGFERAPTHDPVAWVVATELNSGKPFDGAPHEEVAWTLGLEAWRRAARSTPMAHPPSAFPHGGVYTLDGARTHVAVRCGDVGQKGVGGHAHNDALTFELSYAGIPFVVDSGTYAYTFDPVARNEMRATAAQNTLRIDGREINPIAGDELFALRQHANVRVPATKPDTLIASHDGYRDVPGGPVTVERTFSLDGGSGTLRFTDTIDGAGEHLVESFLHLAPGTEVRAIADGELALVRAGQRLTLRAEGAPVAIERGWVSDSYGTRQKAPVVAVRARLDLPARLELELAPIPAHALVGGGVAEVTA